MRPAKEKEVLDYLNKNVVYKITRANFVEKVGTPAFVFKQEAEYAGKPYNINIDSSVDENSDFYHYLLLHECGHIVFNHVSNSNVFSDDILKGKIDAIYNKVREIDPKFTSEGIENGVKSILLNQVTDFEVNSKLFSEDEQAYLEQITSDFVGHETQICLPQYFNFPAGKTANEYLLYILRDVEKWLKDLANQDGKSKKGNKSSSNGSSSGKLTKEEKEKLEKQFSKGDKEEKAKEEQKQQEEKGDSKSKEAGTSNETEEVTSSGEVCEDMNSLQKKILQALYNKEETSTKRNILYYYNRDKYHSNIMHVKETRQSIIRDSNMKVLLDVSGSVDEDLIKQFIEVFKNIAKAISKKCRIVFWNTDLVGDYSSKEDFPIEIGGGTDIGEGIKYLADDTKDLLFVVSDCEDDLEYWENIYKGEKYLISWERHEFEEDFKKEWNKIFFYK